MKNVSFYIARRYNTHTLLISMILLLITSFLTGTFIYIGNVATEIFRKLLYGNETINGRNQFILYSLVTAYIIGQTSLIYIFFDKLLKRISKKSKLLIAVTIALVSLGSAALINFPNHYP